MGETRTFSIIGVLLPTPDVPCFCTPVLRDTDGRNTYLQTMNANGTISDFVPINLGPKIDGFRSVYKNDCITIGDNLIYGFKDIDSEIIIGDRNHLIDCLEDKVNNYNNFPFLYLQLSIFTYNIISFQNSTRHPLIISSLRRGSLKFNSPIYNKKYFKIEGNYLDALTVILVNSLHSCKIPAAEIAWITKLDLPSISDIVKFVNRQTRMHITGTFKKQRDLFDSIAKPTNVILSKDHIFKGTPMRYVGNKQHTLFSRRGKR